MKINDFNNHANIRTTIKIYKSCIEKVNIKGQQFNNRKWEVKG